MQPEYMGVHKHIGRGYSMQTASGGVFYPLDPRPEDICIEDIAHALSNMCRFNGHCKEFYSVAQHSVIVSEIVPEDLALDGLLHDAAETYVGDIIRPVKNNFLDWWEKTYEEPVWLWIANKFELIAPMPSAVKRADLIALAIEKRDLMAIGDIDCFGDLPDITIYDTLIPLPPIEAKELFLNRYKELTDGRS